VCTTPDPLDEVVPSSPPADLRLGLTESNSCILLFDEQQGVTLDVALSAAPPATDNAVGKANISLPAGSVVKSYYVHSDKNGSSSTGVRFRGTHTFDNDVIGFEVTATGLNNTNTLLGVAPDLTYDTAGQGLEASQIGRASCRERGRATGHAETLN